MTFEIPVTEPKALFDLEPGTYSVTVAPDIDLDDQPDDAGTTTEFTLIQRGQVCPLTIPGRTTCIVTLKQTTPGRGQQPTPDLGIGAIKANDGEAWPYPVAIGFV